MKSGEIHWVNFDPAVGDEIRKRRPVVIINGGHEKHLKPAIVVPVTKWSPQWEKNPFFVTLESNDKTGLKKKSAVDCFQIGAISHHRFPGKFGEISVEEMTLIKGAPPLILDIEPEHCK